jgi:hypothetical protein
MSADNAQLDTTQTDILSVDQLNQYNISEILRMKQPQSTAPTYTPTKFIDQFYFYDNGTVKRLYVYINATWQFFDLGTITNLSAGNVKNGVTIKDVTGTFPNDGDAAVGDVATGKTFYSYDATKRTGTYVPTLGSLSYVTVSSIYRVYYYNIGKYYIIAYLYDTYGNHWPIFSDANTRNVIASALGITVSSWGEANNLSGLVRTFQYTNPNWVVQFGAYMLNYIQST